MLRELDKKRIGVYVESEELAIKVDNITKCYRIGLKEEMNESFVGSVMDFIKSPIKNFQKYRSLYQFDDVDYDLAMSNEQLDDLFVALRNISFEVKKGEVLGIIGKNGAGKSTLLKILSRITFPTRGQIEIHGRSSSLLEVGTGFHPELTGRENVYLNGTLLGMKKTEIDKKFDEIVKFSGVAKFLDTPVKRYSSGMNVRLAFAVAAHLEPEILIVDEVLAVGDAEFQAKCLGKMSNVAKQGRTVLFVSHNMGAITQLCSRVLWIDRGQLREDGLPTDVVSKYLSAGVQGVGNWVRPTDEPYTGRWAWLRRACIFTANDNCIDILPLVHFNQSARIELEYEIIKGVKDFSAYLFLRDAFGNLIWVSHDNDCTFKVGDVREPGVYHSTCEFPEGLLNPGQYFVSIGITGKPREAVQKEYFDIMNFNISEAGYPFKRNRLGIISPALNWTVNWQQKVVSTST